MDEIEKDCREIIWDSLMSLKSSRLASGGIRILISGQPLRFNNDLMCLDHE